MSVHRHRDASCWAGLSLAARGVFQTMCHRWPGPHDYATVDAVEDVVMLGDQSPSTVAGAMQELADAGYLEQRSMPQWPDRPHYRIACPAPGMGA